MPKPDGLKYTIADVETGHSANIEMLASENPAVAAAARLNRDLVNVMEAFLASESMRQTNSIDVMAAAAHGVTTVCGTLLLQVSHHKRPALHGMMRKHLLDIFDAMGAAILKEPA